MNLIHLQKILRTKPNDGFTISALALMTALTLTSCGFFGSSDASQEKNNPLSFEGDGNNGTGKLPFQEVLTPAQSSALEVRDYTQIESNNGRINTTQKINPTEEVSIADALGNGTYGKDELALAANRVLKANEHLVGLAPQDGQIELVGTNMDESVASVTYEQTQTVGNRQLPVFGSKMAVLFNDDGEVKQIQNLTFKVGRLANREVMSHRAITARAMTAITAVPLDVDLDRSAYQPAGENDGALAAQSFISSFTATSAEVMRLGIYAQDENIAPAVAYEVRVEGTLGNGFKHAVIATLDANSGALLASHAAHAGATGNGNVYDPNNIEAPDVQRPLFKLSNNSLMGQFAEVHNTAMGEATNTSNQHFYIGQPFPVYYHSAEVTLYAAIYSSKIVMDRFGFPMAMNFPLWADAMDNSYSGSGYDPALNRLYVHNGGDNGKDMDVMRHEYGHAITDAMGAVINYYDGVNAPVAEGIADAFAVLFNMDPQVAEGAAAYLGSAFIRTTDSSYNMLYNYDNNIVNKYSTSIIYSAFWFDFALKVGNGTAMKILLASQPYLLPTDSIVTAFESAVIPAIYASYTPTEAAQLELVARRAAATHGIYSTPAANPFASSTIPVPYLDNQDTSLTFNGANGQTSLIFSPYTRTWKPSTGSGDLVYVSNSVGVPVPGSPFNGRQLQNKQIVVADNSARVRLVSVQNNLRSDAGVPEVYASGLNAGNQPPTLVPVVSATSGMDPMRLSVDMRQSTDSDGAIKAAWVTFSNIPNWTLQLDPSYLKFEQILNRDGAGPITAPLVVTVTVNIMDDQGAVTSQAIPVTVNPYTDQLPPFPTFVKAVKKKCKLGLATTATTGGTSIAFHCP